MADENGGALTTTKKASASLVIGKDFENFRNYIEARLGTIQKIAGEQMSAERMYRIALNCVTRTPKLQQCTVMSVYRCVLQAAELGLEAGNPNEAHLVPFNNKVKVKENGKEVERYQMECILIPDYRGLIKIAVDSGRVGKVDAYPVYEGDVFEVQLGDEPHIHHCPKFETTDPSKMTHVYAVGHLVNGMKQFEVLTKAEVDRIKASSKASSSGPWVDWRIPMARKSAVKRLYKWLPKTRRMAKAEALETALETGDFSLVDFDEADAIPAHFEPEAVEEVSTEPQKLQIPTSVPEAASPAAPAESTVPVGTRSDEIRHLVNTPGFGEVTAKDPDKMAIRISEITGVEVTVDRFKAMTPIEIQAVRKMIERQTKESEAAKAAQTSLM